MPSIDEGDWWLAWDGSKAIGFAGMHPSQVWTKTGYFCAAGVLPSHQGQGLQKRLINVRLSRAAVLGYEWAITYTMKDNYPSINNLLACGFRAYEPRKKWAGIKDVMYWKRKT
jgi:GNAT superfamily N-acetyltransferase